MQDSYIVTLYKLKGSEWEKNKNKMYNPTQRDGKGRKLKLK